VISKRFFLFKGRFSHERFCAARDPDQVSRSLPIETALSFGVGQIMTSEKM
jgi:hypothetical protein